MSREGQVFGNRMSRSAYGLESNQADQVWRLDAICRHEPDAWFRRGSQFWALAAHKCRRHCPVLQECGAALKQELAAKVHPIDAVVAGVRFNAVGRPRPTTSGVTCDLCTPAPAVDDPRVEADIAAYANRRRPTPLSSPAPAPPSDRRVQLLQFLSDGLSDADIAARLWLSQQHVKTRLRLLYRELGVHSRRDAVAKAVEQGLLT